MMLHKSIPLVNRLAIWTDEYWTSASFSESKEHGDNSQCLHWGHHTAVVDRSIVAERDYEQICALKAYNQV